MKTTLFTISLAVFCAVSLEAQNDIINTLGSTGTFSIKDGSTTFFTLTQSDGKVSLNKTLTLPVTTDSSVGVILKGNDRFIHDFKASGTDGHNTFVGVNAGNFTMSGFLPSQASYNTAVGHSSLTSNTTGSGISAFGYISLYSNTTGDENSAFGNYSLGSNTTGSANSAFGVSSLGSNTTSNANSAFGNYSLRSNSTGNANSAFGVWSLNQNTTGNKNSAFGYTSLYSNTTSYENSAFGVNSLYSNTTGNRNSAFGTYSLNNNATGWGNSGFGNYVLYSSTGSFNTAVGDSAGINITSGSNNTAIGYNAQVPTATASNQVRIGNTSVSYAGVQVAWTITSDRRWKSNISPTDLGLDFLSMLNPVSYTRKNDDRQRTEYGFIAQEIEEVLKQSGVNNAGMLTVDDEGRYELRYNDLLAPIVKAIQELKTENDALKAKVLRLEEAYSASSDKTKHDDSVQLTGDFR